MRFYTLLLLSMLMVGLVLVACQPSVMLSVQRTTLVQTTRKTTKLNTVDQQLRLAAPCRPGQPCDDNGGGHEVELPEDPSPLVVTIQSVGLGPSREVAITSKDSFAPTTVYFRTNEPFTLSASATDVDGVLQVALVGAVKTICYGQRTDAASPQPGSVFQQEIREEITVVNPAGSLSATKELRAADFPCAAHSPARIEFTVHAEGRNVDDHAFATYPLKLVYIATLNVMTFNIHEGVGGIGRNFEVLKVYDLNNAVRVIQQNDTDIALLQEVRRHWDDESHWEDQVVRLRQQTGMYAAYTPLSFRFRPWSCLNIGFWTNPSCLYPERDSGLLVLSRFPIVSNTFIELKRLERGIGVLGWPQTDTLGFQEVVVDVGGTLIRVLNLHNCLGETDMCPSWDDQWIVTNGVLEHVGTPDLPVLLGGDFNIGMELESDSTRPIMNSTFEHVCFLYHPCINWSVSSFDDGWFHWSAIDHLFVWDNGRPKLEVLDGYVPYTGSPPFQASDHFPLVARLMFSDNKVQPAPTVIPGATPISVVTPTAGGQCVQACEDSRNFCMDSVGGPGGARPQECVGEYRACMQTCAP